MSIIQVSSILPGNHGTFGPVLTGASDTMSGGQGGKSDKCPLVRCLSAREARMVKRSKSFKHMDLSFLRKQRTYIKESTTRLIISFI